LTTITLYKLFACQPDSNFSLETTHSSSCNKCNFFDFTRECVQEHQGNRTWTSTRNERSLIILDDARGTTHLVRPSWRIGRGDCYIVTGKTIAYFWTEFILGGTFRNGCKWVVFSRTNKKNHCSRDTESGISLKHSLINNNIIETLIS
jgi:hypothetical protein